MKYVLDSPDALLLTALFDLRRHVPDSASALAKAGPSDAAAFHVASRRMSARWIAMPFNGSDNWRAPLPLRGGWSAVAREAVGDAPDKYHPVFAMAVLSARPGDAAQNQGEASPESLQDTTSDMGAPHEYSWNTQADSLASWLLPKIDFSTAPEVRRSMTLNGMRMTIEYTQSGSTRVLQLIESRLEAGQRDVVHDVLVYLMRQVIDTRQNEAEARDLRAESVAAYLGLNELKTRMLFAMPRLSIPTMARRIELGFAGPKRRHLDVEALLRGQISHLRPDLRSLKQREASLLWLLDEIVARLFAPNENI